MSDRYVRVSLHFLLKEKDADWFANRAVEVINDEIAPVGSLGHSLSLPTFEEIQQVLEETAAEDALDEKEL